MAMSALFKKLNFKGQRSILICQAPSSFDAECSAMEEVCEVRRQIHAGESIQFALVFVTSLLQIAAAARDVFPLLAEDAVCWMAYPKGSSKRYTCEFNRDNGWQALGDLGYEPVRQVAVDEDWSALRFRKVEKIKIFTRSSTMALTETGKKRATRQ